MNTIIKNKIIEIIKTQPQRLITVKANLLKFFGRKKYRHILEIAALYIYNYDHPYYCNSTEEKVFSAMQEGRYW